MTNPLAEFEAIYVINLPSRADRRRETSEQLAKLGLSFDAPQVTIFPAVRPEDPGPFPSIGSRGCFMSHLGVLKSAVGKRSILILEDDVDFVADMSAPALPHDWGIFYGGARHTLTPTGRLTVAAPSEGLGCTHFVAINGAVIPQLAAYLETLLSRPPGDPAGGPMHVDGAYTHFRADHPQVITYLATPELGFQRPSRTDIDALRWFDRMPIVRDVAQWMRRHRPARQTGT
jgi:glycosyl transferase, family 25